EPAAGSLLILLASGTDRQLPTILSRCQVVRFAPLGPADLDAVLAEQGIDDPARRDRLARLAGGSPGLAKALGDDAIWEVRRKLVEGLTATRPNFAALAQTWQHFYEEAGKDTAAQRMRVSLVIRLLVEALRRALRLSLGADGTWPPRVGGGRRGRFVRWPCSRGRLSLSPGHAPRPRRRRARVPDRVQQRPDRRVPRRRRPQLGRAAQQRDARSGRAARRSA